MHTPQRDVRSSADAMMPRSPPMTDTTLYPWNWGEEARNVNLSPGSSCSSPEYRDHHHSGSSGSIKAGVTPGTRNSSESHRRGRPRADALTNLMMQGSTSPSSIKCTFCNRVFPREKSLQAHLRTHTGKLSLVFIDNYNYNYNLETIEVLCDFICISDFIYF